jgi:muramidase (phage lysozyme)
MPIAPGTKIIQPVDVSKQFYYELTPQRLAILGVIAFTEGTDKTIGLTRTGYDILFGFGRFTPGTDHPRIHVPFGRTTSTAAGRYQFLDFTWDFIQSRLKRTGFKPFPSFTPDYQDQAALFLIDAKRNVLDEVDKGDIDGFLEEASFEWASFPNPQTGRGRFGQPSIPVAPIKKVYNDYLAIL